MAAKDSKNEDTKDAESTTQPAAGAALAAQPAPQGEQRQIQIRMDDSQMRSSYANGFRTNTTAEEIIVDFGLNLPVLPGQQSDKQEMLLKLDTRVIMNYYSAKRLALTLSQMVHQHEQQFGELQLDASKRLVSQ